MRVCIKVVDRIKDPLGDQPVWVLGRKHWLSWGFMLPVTASCFGSADPSNQRSRDRVTAISSEVLDLEGNRQPGFASYI